MVLFSSRSISESETPKNSEFESVNFKILACAIFLNQNSNSSKLLQMKDRPIFNLPDLMPQKLTYPIFVIPQKYSSKKLDFFLVFFFSLARVEILNSRPRKKYRGSLVWAIIWIGQPFTHLIQNLWHNYFSHFLNKHKIRNHK